MATGYTSNLYDGKEESFEQFVLHCSRAMGAFIMQRDDSSSDLPQKREVSGYYLKNIEKAKVEFEVVSFSTEKELRGAYEDYLNATFASNTKRKEEKLALRNRYQDRLEEIRAWHCGPTLQSLKNFMVEQIESSISFDCSPYTIDVEPYQDWLSSRLESAKRGMTYAHESYAKEVQRVQEQNIYTEAIYKSLGLEYGDVPF